MIDCARNLVTVNYTLPESDSNVNCLFPTMTFKFCNAISSVFSFDMIATQLSSEELLCFKWRCDSISEMFLMKKFLVIVSS